MNTDCKTLPPRQILKKYIPGDRQQQGLILDSSISENLILKCFRDRPYTMHHLMNRKAAEKLGQEQIQAFDIRAESAQQLAASFSGGNQQKIVIARALYIQPTLLVTVFPTHGLESNLFTIECSSNGIIDAQSCWYPMNWTKSYR